MASANPQQSSGAGLQFERFAPLALSIVTAIALFVYHDRLLVAVAEKKFEAQNLYSAIFTWSAIQVGFTFGVYGFILTKADGFVGEMRKSLAMIRFSLYVRRGTFGGFVLTVVSIPIAAISPNPASSNLSYYAVALWFSLFVWTFLAFIRIGYNFGQLSSVPDQEPFYGA